MKKHDLIIFGATGFTGRFLVERLVRIIQKNKLNLKWAVAARNVDNLKVYMNNIGKMCQVDLKQVPIYKTDLEHPNTLNDAFKNTTLVVNCVGPYSLLGDPVVKSCIDSGAHYIDLSGEPLFMEKIQLKYDHLAREKKITVINSCGFDSIPSDIGASYLKNKFPGRLNHTENYLQVWFHENSRFSYATWRSMVEGYRYQDELKHVRKQIFSKYKSFQWPVKIERKTLKRNQFGYCVPFPGSDRSVVARSQMYRYTHSSELPIQCEMYLGLPNLATLLKLAILNLHLKILTRSDWGVELLLKNSRYFSLGIFEQSVFPRREHLEANKFRITIVGKGWPNGCSTLDEKNMTLSSAVVINGGDLGYIDTAKISIQVALTLLDKIKNNQNPSGVLTPASVFEPHELVPPLNNQGVQFDFILKY